jgi:hypothetical protein
MYGFKQSKVSFGDKGEKVLSRMTHVDDGRHQIRRKIEICNFWTCNLILPKAFLFIIITRVDSIFAKSVARDGLSACS